MPQQRKRTGVIKELKRGNKTLVHSREYDYMGILRDNFEILEVLPDGTMTHKPIWTPLKVRDISKDDNIFDDTNDYTDEEYEEFLTKEE